MVNVWKLLNDVSGGAHLLPVELPEPAPNLDTASAQLPGGAYTTLRTYRGCYALRLEDHFDRLEHTAALAGHPLQVNRKQLRAALRLLAQGYQAGMDQRFRLTVDLERQVGEVFLSVEPLSVPAPASYTMGAAAITCDLQRLLPEAKLTRFIERAGKVRSTLPPGVNEAIMVDADRFLREGLSSNFFAVRSGELWTANEGVLCGVTRAMTLDCAQRLDIPLRLEPVRLDDLSLLDEAFITSASRGVLPLQRIDAAPLGPPGSITRRIMLTFDDAIAAEIEPI